jgi:DNA (cytosine-5)-methyltransferase 1
MSKSDVSECDVWDPSVEVEANGYNWEGDPVVTERREKSAHTDLIHLDLFSGCGGFSTGFEAATFTTLAAVDIHPPSLETLRANHASTSTILGDIRKVKTDNLLEIIPEFDRNAAVITAGVPCQGFSLSNRKRHAEDQRNYLFHEFIRIVREIRPAAIVLENVSGLVSTKNGAFKREIANAIRELGYDPYFSVPNAARYGVPQLRKRIVFVGVPKGSHWLFPSPILGEMNTPYRTVAEAILGDLPKLGPGAEAFEYTSLPLNPYQQLLRISDPALSNHKSPAHPQSTVRRISDTLPGEPMYESFKQRIRLHPDQPSPTQICGGIRPQFQFGHPTQPRGLTIRERARIQSFPDSYFFSGGVTQGRVQTGNAVPPLLAQAIAHQLRQLLNGETLEGIPAELIASTLF